MASSTGPRRPKLTFSFNIETRIKTTFAAAYDFYVKPEDIPTLHPLAQKVEVTNVSDSSVSFVVYDSIPLCGFVSIPVSTKATFFLDTTPPHACTSKTVRVEGTAPSVVFWSTTTFAADPADSGSCIVTEQYNCVCPWLAKNFTRAKAYEAHVEVFITFKRLLEERAAQ